MKKKSKYKTLKIVTAAAVIYFLFFRGTTKPMAPTTTNATDEENIKSALRKIYNIYGYDKTKKLEQLYRKETAHFKSGQYKGTYSPGMEPSPNTNKTFPYGWTSLEKFAQAKGYAPTQFYLRGPYTEGGTGKQKYFIGFPDLFSAMLFVMYVVEKRGWNFGKWRAFDETISNNYNASLNTIIPRITNTFL